MSELRPPLPDRVRLNVRFDAAALAADLERLRPADWIAHFVTQNYQGDWSVIPLRGPAGASHPVMMIYPDPSCAEFADTPFLDHCPNIRRSLTRFSCPLLAVRLMKLAAGSRIKEHADYDLDAENGTVRLHIPVVTNDLVDFRLNGTRVALQAGECWYLRLSDPHCVENNGDSDRVHLVIDAELNPWLQAQLGPPPGMPGGGV